MREWKLCSRDLPPHQGWWEATIEFENKRIHIQAYYNIDGTWYDHEKKPVKVIAWDKSFDAYQGAE